jgi:hypothetical protein
MLMGQIILQASPSKYLIEHEHVKNYILSNMNVLKITNDVLCLQTSFKLVLPNISFNMNVLKIISLVEKEGINNCRNDWVLSRRGQKRL